MILTALVYICALFLVQIFFREMYTKRFVRIGICVVPLVFVILSYGYLTYKQYTGWLNAGPPSSYLLPPYQSVEYLLGYHATRFLLYYGISFTIASIFFVTARFYNEKHDELFFEPEEPYLGALVIFLLGNPEGNYLWTWYLVALLGVYLLWHFIEKEVKNQKSETRLPLYYLWLPVSILVILIREIVARM